MEALSYVVEETESNIMARFCEKLAEDGFEDFHNSAIVKASDSLNELLGIDFMKQKSFVKVFAKSSRPHLLINIAKRSIITLTNSVEMRCAEGRGFEVTCFLKSREEAIDLATTTKSLLTKEIGFPSTSIHDGSFDDNCNKALINTFPETARSNLVKNVSKDILSVFTNMEKRPNSADYQ